MVSEKYNSFSLLPAVVEFYLILPMFTLKNILQSLSFKSFIGSKNLYLIFIGLIAICSCIQALSIFSNADEL